MQSIYYCSSFHVAITSLLWQWLRCGRTSFCLVGRTRSSWVPHFLLVGTCLFRIQTGNELGLVCRGDEKCIRKFTSVLEQKKSFRWCSVDKVCFNLDAVLFFKSFRELKTVYLCCYGQTDSALCFGDVDVCSFIFTVPSRCSLHCWQQELLRKEMNNFWGLKKGLKQEARCRFFCFSLDTAIELFTVSLWTIVGFLFKIFCTVRYTINLQGTWTCLFGSVAL